MAYPKELEERIDKLEKNFNRYQGKIHSLENTVFGTGKEEPDYLQVGDQWRDSEGNEYVLAMMDKSDKGEHPLDPYPWVYWLVNKETGKSATNNEIGYAYHKGYIPNDQAIRGYLGITDSMTKIK